MKLIRLFFLSVLFLTACTGSWTNSSPLVYSQEDIWAVTYREINRNYDIIKASRKEWELETAWRVHRAPTYLMTFRERVFAKIEPYDPKKEKKDKTKVILPPDEVEKEKKEAKYILKIRIQREQNRNMDDPAATSDAFWTPSENNVEEEQRLMGIILRRLKLAESFREQDEKLDEKNSKE